MVGADKGGGGGRDLVPGKSQGYEVSGIRSALISSCRRLLRAVSV